ncbi:hypothetical protein Tco_0893604 [Tanacetum coccineum]|uniref:Reverse transcriptase domain-containing protein n=1 Tax=Tanacetum coccineum TaxID=301880 RepID=A0ABQ5CC36_9ASTR
MKGASEQLQELTVQGFIRPSHSPWGARISCKEEQLRVQFLGHVIDCRAEAVQCTNPGLTGAAKISRLLRCLKEGFWAAVLMQREQLRLNARKPENSHEGGWKLVTCYGGLKDVILHGVHKLNTLLIRALTRVPGYEETFLVAQYECHIGTMLGNCLNCAKAARVHNTFHVSNLKKCYSDDPLVVPLEGLQVDDKLHFVKEPVEIMDREVKQLRRSRVHNLSSLSGIRAGPWVFTFGNVMIIQEEISTPLHLDRTIHQCRVISLEDKAHLMGEDYNNSCFRSLYDIM